MPVALVVLGGIPVMLATLGALLVLIGAALAWPPARRHLIARAWCVITPHRVRVGCAQAWIHSRRGKIPIVLLTTRQPLGSECTYGAGLGPAPWTSPAHGRCFRLPAGRATSASAATNDSRSASPLT